MPLTTGELDRIKVELGYNVLNTSAQPYIGVAMMFDQVVRPYLREGADTTSATQVVAASAGAFATLAVVSATGMALHERIAVDVDDYLEMATIRSISGLNIGVILKKAHEGTYPVTVDGGLQRVRECLSALYRIHQLIGELEGTGGLKQVDEIHWYDAHGKSQLQLLNDQLAHWRNELAIALGVPRRATQANAGGTCALY